MCEYYQYSVRWSEKRKLSREAKLEAAHYFNFFQVCSESNYEDCSQITWIFMYWWWTSCLQFMIYCTALGYLSSFSSSFYNVSLVQTSEILLEGEKRKTLFLITMYMAMSYLHILLYKTHWETWRFLFMGSPFKYYWLLFLLDEQRIYDTDKQKLQSVSRWQVSVCRLALEWNGPFLLYLTFLEILCTVKDIL